MNQANELVLRKLMAISDYQFGPKITDILFQNPNNIEIERSKNTNKIRYVYENEQLLLTLKPTVGFFTITFLSALKIIENTKPPKMRTIVLTEISEFIKKGRNVFCKHVIDVDKNLRPNDEVIVVNEEDNLLAIGRIKIPIDYILSFKRGVAIDVRKGIL
ncbi:MAG: pseudouridine synthase [Candidatus Lokiarchaeota archaeon]|nr:pseudouridine synthase [Candidatus Lokiarchaeota archaeon]MBD3198882.1 pseudouridine synthase [Candidatus Lokiarchaeota archaeon]